jgi:hypothetical protein
LVSWCSGRICAAYGCQARLGVELRLGCAGTGNAAAIADGRALDGTWGLRLTGELTSCSIKPSALGRLRNHMSAFVLASTTIRLFTPMKCIKSFAEQVVRKLVWQIWRSRRVWY